VGAYTLGRYMKLLWIISAAICMAIGGSMHMAAAGLIIGVLLGPVGVFVMLSAMSQHKKGK